jgi:lysophospholipase L1-like esterase
MVEGDYNAVRFLYGNYGTGTYDITSAKTAPSPDIANAGTGLTWANVTFNSAATAKCSDTYSGSAGSTTSYTVPARISGSGANCVPSLVWSDWVPQKAVPCTDAGSTDLCIIHHRVYTATTSFTVSNSGTSSSNFGDYNTNSRRKVWGQLTAGDQVGTITSVTMQPNHQWLMCLGVQALLTKPIYNHAGFGDSIMKGQGSFDQNNGAWGWMQRGVQGLADSGVSKHSVVNYAVSGQAKAATWTTFLNVISQGGLDTAILFPWSPNDGIAAGSTPWALNDFLFQVYAAQAECKKYGVALIVATQVPYNGISDVAGDNIRKANNDTIRELANQGFTVADFDFAVSNQASPARYKTGLSVDNVHPSSAGHAVMAKVYQEAIKEALGL